MESKWDFSRARIGFGERCVESIGEYDQRQSIVSKCNTHTPKLLLGNVCIVDHPHHLCHNVSSHMQCMSAKSHENNGSDERQ